MSIDKAKTLNLLREDKHTSIQIISDGTPQNTTIMTDSGQSINGIVEISWNIKADEIAEAVVKFGNVKVNVISRNLTLKE